jgi:anti-sigma factor RsiW
MMSCRRVAEGEPGGAHLAECEHCARYAAQLGATVGLAGRLTSPPLGDRLRERLLRAFRERAA